MTSTFVAGLRREGITAPCVIDGAINGESFRAYVELFLAPALAFPRKGAWPALSPRC